MVDARRRRQRHCSCLAVAGAHLVLACSSAAPRDAGVTTTDSAGIRITTVADAAVKALPTWHLAETTDHVFDAASVGDSTAFALVGPVQWLGNGALVVADLRALRLHVFDSTGAYHGALGRRGKGPGEFSAITSVTPMRGDTLAVFDATQRRLTIWSAARGLVRQVGLQEAGSLSSQPWGAWPWQDSLVVVLQVSLTPRPTLTAGEATKPWPTRAQLSLKDSTGRLIAAGPIFDGWYTAVFSNGDAHAPFSHKAFAAVAHDRVVYGTGDRFQINSLGSPFTATDEVRVPAFDEPFDRSEATRVLEESVVSLSAYMPADAARERLALSFDPAMFPERRPSIGRVLSDDQRRLWVERFEPMRPGAELQVPGSRWTVLAADGRPIARLQLPPRTRLEAVRGDRVAVVQWDELDVQSAAIHALQR